MKLLFCFIIILFINYSESGLLQCKECANKSNELRINELKKARQEYLKMELLKQLQLTEPPKISSSSPPPESALISELIKNGTVVERVHDPQFETSVIYARNGNHSCKGFKSKPCSRFEFVITQKLQHKTFASFELWISRNNAKGVRAYHIIKDNRQNSLHKQRLHREKTGDKASSWRKYNILGDINLLKSVPENILAIEIVDIKNKVHLKNIRKNEKEMPLLVIRSEVEVKGTSRQRRSPVCVGKNPSCCRQDFYLDFGEIGWGNWIIHPAGYHANFCRGSCYDDVSNSRFYHSTILLNYIHDKQRLAKKIGIGMCCTPSVMAPITLFYRNEDTFISMKRIENMRVETCDCA